MESKEYGVNDFIPEPIFEIATINANGKEAILQVNDLYFQIIKPGVFRTSQGICRSDSYFYVEYEKISYRKFKQVECIPFEELNEAQEHLRLTIELRE